MTPLSLIRFLFSPWRHPRASPPPESLLDETCRRAAELAAVDPAAGDPRRRPTRALRPRPPRRARRGAPRALGRADGGPPRQRRRGEGRRGRRARHRRPRPRRVGARARGARSRGAAGGRGGGGRRAGAGGAGRALAAREGLPGGRHEMGAGGRRSPRPRPPRLPLHGVHRRSSTCRSSSPPRRRPASSPPSTRLGTRWRTPPGTYRAAWGSRRSSGRGSLVAALIAAAEYYAGDLRNKAGQAAEETFNPTAVLQGQGTGLTSFIEMTWTIPLGIGATLAGSLIVAFYALGHRGREVSGTSWRRRAASWSGPAPATPGPQRGRRRCARLRAPQKRPPTRSPAAPAGRSGARRRRVAGRHARGGRGGHRDSNLGPPRWPTTPRGRRGPRSSGCARRPRPGRPRAPSARSGSSSDTTARTRGGQRQGRPGGGAP